MSDIKIAEVRAFLKEIEGQEITLDKLRSELGIEKYDLNGKITKCFDGIRAIVFSLVEQKLLRHTSRGQYVVVKRVTTHIITINEVRTFLKEIEGQEISLYKLRSELGIEKYDPLTGHITKSFIAIRGIVDQLVDHKLLRYKSRGVVQVITSQPAATERPSAMEITPKTPYSNLLNLRQILQNCERHIWWADRYFNPRGLEELIRTIDPALVREVRILSGSDNVDERAKREFARFCEELEHKGVSAEWRVLKGFAHDRFILSENACFVVPSIDTIVRGQYSQILETPNHPPFDEWWKVAIPIRDYKS